MITGTITIEDHGIHFAHQLSETDEFQVSLTVTDFYSGRSKTITVAPKDFHAALTIALAADPDQSYLKALYPAAERVMTALLIDDADAKHCLRFIP